MKDYTLAPSEKHLEDWIDYNRIQFGDRLAEQDYYWKMGEAHFRSDNTCVLPFFDAIVAKQPSFPCGIPDLIGYTCGQLTIVELKKDAITYAAIGQCLRYIHDLNEALNWLHDAMYSQPQHIKELYNYVRPTDFEQCEYPSNEIVGMVVGHHLEDKHLTRVAAACNIRLVTYEFVNDEYLFELLSVDRPKMQTYIDFAKGEINGLMLQMMKDQADRQRKTT